MLRLRQLPRDELPALDDIKSAVSEITQPVDPVWCMARVAALLNPYFDKDTPQVVREMDAEDWMEALAPYPQWAIERAVRWWKSEHNPDRRKKPLEGDIAARCKVEMHGVKSLPHIFEHHLKDRQKPVEVVAQLPRVTPETAARIMAEAGFTPKRFGGAAK